MGKITRMMAALAIAALMSTAASAQGTLRIGMTASDIPLTTGQTDQGGEGMRFMGYTVYDGLINWDLSSFDKPSDLAPGLVPPGWQHTVETHRGRRARAEGMAVAVPIADWQVDRWG